MKRDLPDPAVKEAERICRQLLEYTSQLASCGDGFEVDVAALSRACHSRLADLQALPPLPTPAPLSLRKAMSELYDRSAICIESLKRMQDKIGGELDALARTRRAIRAYGAGGR